MTCLHNQGSPESMLSVDVDPNPTSGEVAVGFASFGGYYVVSTCSWPGTAVENPLPPYLVRRECHVLGCRFVTIEKYWVESLSLKSTCLVLDSRSSVWFGSHTILCTSIISNDSLQRFSPTDPVKIPHSQLKIFNYSWICIHQVAFPTLLISSSWDFPKEISLIHVIIIVVRACYCQPKYMLSVNYHH